MIFQPRVGERVVVHYRKSLAEFMPHHGKAGVVEAKWGVTKGAGGRIVGNVRVRFDDGSDAVVPRGNLRRPQ